MRASPPVASVQTTDTTARAAGIPVHLSIPKIGVDTKIEQVGITPQGALDAPYGPRTAGWFYLGPRPGEIGSAVIDGHAGFKGGIPAIFDDLDKLVPGDMIYVEDEDGNVIPFIVRTSTMYGEHDPTAEVFNSTDGKAHLNLITCEGIWNKETKSYSHRLVVMADMLVDRSSLTDSPVQERS
ncbi:MAG: class F sortase [bacterium]|nr:class F sortase [bacterium]